MNPLEQDFEMVQAIIEPEWTEARAALDRIRTALADAEQMVVGNALWVEVRAQNRALRTEVEELRVQRDAYDKQAHRNAAEVERLQQRLTVATDDANRTIDRLEAEVERLTSAIRDHLDPGCGHYASEHRLEQALQPVEGADAYEHVESRGWADAQGKGPPHFHDDTGPGFDVGSLADTQGKGETP